MTSSRRWRRRSTGGLGQERVAIIYAIPRAVAFGGTMVAVLAGGARAELVKVAVFCCVEVSGARVVPQQQFELR